MAVDSDGRRAGRHGVGSSDADDTNDSSGPTGESFEDSSEFGEDVVLHLVMEYCSGGTLASYIRELSDENEFSTGFAHDRHKQYAAVFAAQRWFAQILSALSYM